MIYELRFTIAKALVCGAGILNLKLLNLKLIHGRTGESI